MSRRIERGWIVIAARPFHRRGVLRVLRIRDDFEKLERSRCTPPQSSGRAPPGPGEAPGGLRRRLGRLHPFVHQQGAPSHRRSRTLTEHRQRVPRASCEIAPERNLPTWQPLDGPRGRHPSRGMPIDTMPFSSTSSRRNSWRWRIHPTHRVLDGDVEVPERVLSRAPGCAATRADWPGSARRGTGGRASDASAGRPTYAAQVSWPSLHSPFDARVSPGHQDALIRSLPRGRAPIPAENSRRAEPSRCVTNGWREMSGDVGGVCERGADLVDTQRILGGDGASRFTSRADTMIVAISIRVPLRHGFPNRTSGSIETPGKTSMTTTLAPAATFLSG